MGASGERGVRLVFADMDDTFLTRDKRLLPQNLAALDLLAERGASFVPCTGRPVAGIPTQVREHPSVRYAVGSNGGVVIDARTGEAIHREVMDVDLVLRIYELVRHLDVTFDTFVRGHVLTERVRYEAMRGFGVDESNLNVILGIREPQDATVPEFLQGHDGVEKVTLYWCTERDRDEAFAVLSSFEQISVTTSHPKNFEFMARGTSKGSALVWLRDHLGIAPSQTVAFGDADNDLDMIMEAGDGVAMANASEAVRRAADHVCGDCDAAGVGVYLLSVLG